MAPPLKKQLFFKDDAVEEIAAPNSDGNPLSKRAVVLQTYWDDESDLEGEDEDEDDDPDYPEPERIKVPEGKIAISRLNGTEVEIVDEASVRLIDRGVCVGDIVRAKDLPLTTQSGTCTSTKMKVDLRHVQSGAVLEGIDSALIKYALSIEEGHLVSYQNWIGQVDELWDHISIIFSDGSICLPRDQNDLEPADNADRYAFARFYPGQAVRSINRNNLIDGFWQKGQYNPAFNDTGLVHSVTPLQAKIQWFLCNPLQGDKNDYEVEMPQEVILVSALHILESVFEQASYQIGDKVMFKDNGLLAERGLVQGDNSPESFAIFDVVRTETTLAVEWQDGTTANDIPSTDIMPCNHIDDQDMWPSDYVVMKKEGDQQSPADSDLVGLVLSVNARQRNARVRWFNSTMDQLEGPEEELSLYEIVAHPDMQFRLADRVMVTEPEPEANGRANWFGEVIGISKEGQVHVRFMESGDTAYLSPRRLLSIGGNEDPFYDDDEDDEGSDYDSADDSRDGDMDIDGDRYSARKVKKPKKVLKKVEHEDGSGWKTDSEADDGEWETDDDGGDDHGSEDLAVSPRSGSEPLKGDLKSTKAGDTDMKETSTEEDAASKGTIPTFDEPTEGTAAVSPDANWVNFKACDTAPLDHHYYNQGASNYSRSFHQRIQREYMILNQSLPSGILVRTFDDRIDLMRVLMVGPDGTPYEQGLFLFDVLLPPEYPQTPPSVYFHSWTYGRGRLNPNLYEEGKVCLSLLGTWHGKDSETWSPLSNILQVLVSIQGLVLNRNPYYNEAGYERQVGTEEGAVNSLLYTERAYLLVLRSTEHILRHSPQPFVDEVHEHFFARQHLRRMLDRAQQIQDRSGGAGGAGGAAGPQQQAQEEAEDLALLLQETGFPLNRVSMGCKKILKTQTDVLRSLLHQHKPAAAAAALGSGME
ncbi:hypothetical protein DFJ73DRAFT_661686 [Zopfochytrium polystomum]|nr:hypothetical protein DFJ73DRAFT_661686 [Zopfochytrium polystomum]